MPSVTSDFVMNVRMLDSLIGGNTQGTQILASNCLVVPDPNFVPTATITVEAAPVAEITNA